MIGSWKRSKMAVELTGVFFDKKKGRMVGMGTWKAIFKSDGYVQYVPLEGAQDRSDALKRAMKLANAK